MLDTIRSFFASRIAPADEGLPTARELRMAAAALLLEVSRADFNIQEEELKIVADALKSQFGSNDRDVQALLALALECDKDAVSMHPFLRLINEHFTVEQKAQIIENLWRVAYADQRLDKYEEAQIRRIADLLYVPHKAFIKTKLRVMEDIERPESRR